MTNGSPHSNKQTALVTGASSGIGLELATQFAMHGHNVILTARRDEKLKELASKLAAQYDITTHTCSADLSRPDGYTTIAEFTSSNNLTVDVLVNNAGFGARGEFTKVDAATQREIIQVNITSLVDLTHVYLPSMLKKGKGGVLNIASTAAFVAGPFMSVYYASKAFVLSFSEALSNECQGTGVTVCCVCPGATTTEFQARANMTQTMLFRGPAVMTAQDVAQQAYAGFADGESLVITGFLNQVAAFSTRLVPRALGAQLARKMQE